MERLSDIRETLKRLKPELAQKFHVQTIGLFGSVVREDFTQNSDIDIIVDFNQSIDIEFIDLAEFIESKLNTKIDIVSRNGIKDKYYKAIVQEIEYI